MRSDLPLREAALWESLFTLCSASSRVWGTSCHPDGILGVVPKEQAAHMLPSSLAPLQLRGCSRAAHRVPSVTQLATARSKTNDHH